MLLLLVALPIQGALAASRWMCVGNGFGAAGVSADVVGHAHTPTAGAAHRHDGAIPAATPARNHAHHDVASFGVVGTTVQANSHRAADGCRMCAACSLAAATAPTSPTLADMTAAGAGFPAISARVPRASADGPERPPRTI